MMMTQNFLVSDFHDIVMYDHKIFSCEIRIHKLLQCCHNKLYRWKKIRIIFICGQYSFCIPILHSSLFEISFIVNEFPILNNIKGRRSLKLPYPACKWLQDEKNTETIYAGNLTMGSEKDGRPKRVEVANKVHQRSSRQCFNPSKILKL